MPSSAVSTGCFERLSAGYGALTRRLLRVAGLMLVVYGCLIGLT